MKIVDLEVADAKYALEKDLGYEIRNLKYHQKYLLLCIGNEVVSLKIDDVTDTAFYLKIDEEGVVGKT